MAASLANRSHDVPCRLCGGLRRGPQTRISVARLAKDSLSCARVPLRIKTIALRHARGRKIIMGEARSVDSPSASDEAHCRASNTQGLASRGPPRPSPSQRGTR